MLKGEKDISRSSSPSASTASNVAALAIPGLPNHLRCYETATAGRIVKTTISLPKGNVVFSEVPYAHTIHHAYKPTTCDTCFRFAENAVLAFPCPKTCGTYFCRKKCRDVSNHCCSLILGIQKQEGKGKGKKKNKSMHTALSLLASVASYESHNSIKNSTGDTFDDILLMMQDKSKHALAKHRLAEDVFCQILQEYPTPEPQNKGRYSQALATVKLNAFGMYNASGDEIGYSLSPSLAMVNHSCLPNCQQITTNGKCMLIALRDIPIGDELTFCYISLPTTAVPPASCDDEQARAINRHAEILERKNILWDQWEFTCRCARCGDRADCRDFDAEHTCYCGAVCLSVDRSKGTCICNPSTICL